MADRFCASMCIGGEISQENARKLSDLINAIADELDCNPADQSTVVGFLSFDVHEANLDDFSDVIEFCKEHGLDYDLAFDAKWEYSASIDMKRGDRYTQEYCLQGGNELVFTQGELEDWSGKTIDEFLASKPDVIQDYRIVQESSNESQRTSS